ncbi:MAG: hypothetical protein DRJ03_31365 [Chloroflexi bacterium]|nr:MAG: hypothetical protein DRJ03_31365 [Chloroflexota bacterium]
MSVKKLDKVPKDNGVEITVVSTGQSGFYSVDELSPDIQRKLMIHGLSQVLGDAAAGRDGEDASEAIQRRWETLKSGEWTAKRAAAPKLSKAELERRLAGLEDDERQAIIDALAKVGINL